MLLTYLCKETHNHKNTVQDCYEKDYDFFFKVGTNNRNEEAFYSSTKTSKVWEFVEKTELELGLLYIICGRLTFCTQMWTQLAHIIFISR